MPWTKKIYRFLRYTAFFILLSALFFELGCFVATKLNLFLVNDTPTLYKKNNDFPDIVYGRTEKEIWGAWHKSNSSYRHSKSCFNVIMEFNEIGARDEAFSNVNNKSIILLGDSFAEGFGVEKSKSSEYLLEESLKIPILNFGASGNFGPLQEYLIYKQFKDLPHKGIIIYMLPENDFMENDSKVWKDIDETRYRPYFSKGPDPLVPYYFENAVRRDNFLSHKAGKEKQFLKDYFWFSNAFRTVARIQRATTHQKTGKVNNKVTSYFYDAPLYQQKNLIMAYEGIINIAGSRNILIVIIPDQNDIKRFSSEGDPFSYKKQFWYTSLLSMTTSNKQMVSILNLIDYLPSDTDALFFRCDGHWSESGNEWAASTISDHITKTGIFKNLIQDTNSN